MGFKARRDHSLQNVPLIGYQDSADAQDIVLWAAHKVTEIGDTDENGILKVKNRPIIDMTHDLVIDNEGIPRERLIDGKDVIAQTSGGNKLYVGKVQGNIGEIELFTDEERTTSAANLINVKVEFYTLQHLQVDEEGRLLVAGTGGSGEVTIPEVIKIQGYNGVGYEPFRIADTVKYMNITTGTETTVWTPAAGKSKVLQGIYLQSKVRKTGWMLPDADATVKVGGTTILTVKLAGMLHFSETGTDTKPSVYVHDGEFQGETINLGQGIKFGKDQSITVTTDGTPLTAFFWGLEI